MPKRRSTKKPSSKAVPAELPAPTVAPPASASDRLTYRELRNTPGRVWERLADGKPLMLVADGEVKALVIPANGDSADEMLGSYQRARALLAIRQIQAESRRTGRDRMTLAEINTVIKAARRERAALDADND